MFGLPSRFQNPTASYPLHVKGKSTQDPLQSMATLFQQHQKNSNNNGSNANNGANAAAQGNLTLKKLSNGTTIVAMGHQSLPGSSSATSTATLLQGTNGQILTTTAAQQHLQTNHQHAPPTTIILTPSDQNGFSKFVLPSGAQPQPQIIQLQPPYQIVGAPGQLANAGKLTKLGTTTTVMTTTNSPSAPLNGLVANSTNARQQPKIISISNSSPTVLLNSAAGIQTGPQIVGQTATTGQFINAGGNILRLIPTGSTNVATVAGGSCQQNPQQQVIQVMDQDGRIMTLTGIKKPLQKQQVMIPNNNKQTTATVLQQKQPHIVTTTSVGAGVAPVQIISLGNRAVTMPPTTTGLTTAGTTFVDRTNRVSAAGEGAQNHNYQMQQAPQVQQQSAMSQGTAATTDLGTELKPHEVVGLANGSEHAPVSSVAGRDNGVKTVQVREDTENDHDSAKNCETIGDQVGTSKEPAVEGGPENAADGDEPEIDIVINNVVCSFAVRCHLNLREIALSGHNVEYRRENGMVTMKLRKPYTTASMWSSGKITCTGATSEVHVSHILFSVCDACLMTSPSFQAKQAARRYARILQKLDFKVRLHNFRIVNVLGTCHMPWDVKISNFSERHRGDATYEPELHPGVTYKLKTPKATLKIYSTGSVTVTGMANLSAGGVVLESCLAFFPSWLCGACPGGDRTHLPSALRVQEGATG